MRERLGIIGQMIQHLTDNLVHLPVFYGVEPTVKSKRLHNVNGRDTWDAYQWELR